MAARWVVMLAHLYYVRNESIVYDHEFDKLSNYVADHWEELEPIMQHQLGSADDIRSGGSHVLITQMGVGGACHLSVDNHPRGHQMTPWKFPDVKRHEKFNVLFAPMI